MRKAILAAVCALVSVPALAADLPVKASPGPILPFTTPNGSGWYIGAGTEGGVASSNVSGSNLFATNLVGGGLTASGAAVGVDAGYIWGNCFLGTWCQFEVDVKYANIGGANGIGSINSRWSVSEEFDIGSELFKTLFAAVGNLGVNFPSFSPVLPPNVAVVNIPPRQYFGFIVDEYELSGTVGSVRGQTWGIAPGLTTGFRWETVGTNGQPNDGSVKVFAKVEWPMRGVDVSGVFASPVGQLQFSGNTQMSTLYLAGVHMDFGLPGH
jgi:hypothetical protein